ncbi:MAG: hypothetical protein CO189_06805 [candidate division Zixibacteria bacterium CG_4_9_14_3_um_filter_46_8]|nr:MAG: hypothetical protein CO189_06805 [candidate division Zixibacteria bacterium CG_4_9_14_3_um_filter_46_8]
MSGQSVETMPIKSPLLSSQFEAQKMDPTSEYKDSHSNSGSPKSDDDKRNDLEDCGKSARLREKSITVREP